MSEHPDHDLLAEQSAPADPSGRSERAEGAASSDTGPLGHPTGQPSFRAEQTMHPVRARLLERARMTRSDAQGGPSERPSWSPDAQTSATHHAAFSPPEKRELPVGPLDLTALPQELNQATTPTPATAAPAVAAAANPTPAQVPRAAPPAPVVPAALESVPESDPSPSPMLTPAPAAVMDELE
ncbi:MAG TPA: hypothetical protein VN764_05980, partial [Polyangiaceae bacterium]|nr:hypothetical protein [Polyangiaceae bacterium]